MRIRNLSETGALIEGPALPRVGAGIVLRRLDVRIGATVVWSSGPRCGVHFDGRVCVSEWIAGKRGGGSGQARVDVIQATIRSGSEPAPAGAPEAAPSPLSAQQLDDRLAEELAYVRRLLESMGDELIAEPVVVQRHLRTLQNFDLAGQILGHVAAVLKSQDRAAAVEGIGMEELRARLRRRTL